MDGGRAAGEVTPEEGPAGTSRARFLRLLGGGAGAAALAAAAAGCGQTETAAERRRPGEDRGVVDEFDTGDIGIVNYALTLEYIESDFYDEVAGSGEVRGRFLELAKRIGDDERQHAETLQGVAQQLGIEAAARPRTSFDSVLEGGREDILSTAATLENLGAAAYLGQVTRIQGKRLLDAALSIHTVEARHAAALNELAERGFAGGGRLEGSLPDGAFARPMTMREVLPRARRFLRS